MAYDSRVYRVLIASPSDVRQLRVHRSIDSIGPPLLGDVGGNEWSAVHC